MTEDSLSKVVLSVAVQVAIHERPRAIWRPAERSLSGDDEGFGRLGCAAVVVSIRRWIGKGYSVDHRLRSHKNVAQRPSLGAPPMKQAGVRESRLFLASPQSSQLTIAVQPCLCKSEQWETNNYKNYWTCSIILFVSCNSAQPQRFEGGMSLRAARLPRCRSS